MANKTVALKDENNNILLPITKYNAVKDENGNSLPSNFSSLGGDVQVNGTSIVSNGVANLITNTAYDPSLNKLATMSDLAGERYDLIYDMRSEDSAINRGWTSGASCGKTIRVDFSVYKKIRLFISMYDQQVYADIPVADRKKSGFNVQAINSTFSEMYFLRFTFPIANNAIQVGQYGTYTFDLNNNTFSVVKGSSNSDYYVYRLEGIY